MVAPPSGQRAVQVELDLDLHLLGRNRVPADRARLTHTRPAERAVRFSRRQLATPDCFAGLLSKDELFGHGGIPQPGRQYRV